MGILIETELTPKDNSEPVTKGAAENRHILSIIVPVYNEEAVIREFQSRLSDVLDGLSMTVEVIYINDGSSDTTLEVLDTLREQDERIYLLDLSRNFGKELAMTAGLDHACGDAVIIIDADLQDPPELIPDMLDTWQQGFDVVYMKRRSRKGETWFKRLTAYGFYKLISKLGKVKIPENVGDFRLMDRRAVTALCSLREENRFMKGLFAWVGYSQKALLYDRDERFAGETKWNYFKLWTLSLEGVTSFSTAPLKLASMLGLIIASGSFFYGLLVIINTILFGESVRGYPTMMVVILFLGGVQLITTGILGEYLGRMFMETKQRPLYLLKGNTPARSTQKTKINKINRIRE